MKSTLFLQGQLLKDVKLGTKKRGYSWLSSGRHILSGAFSVEPKSHHLAQSLTQYLSTFRLHHSNHKTIYPICPLLIYAIPTFPPLSSSNKCVILINESGRLNRSSVLLHHYRPHHQHCHRQRHCHFHPIRPGQSEFCRACLKLAASSLPSLPLPSLLQYLLLVSYRADDKVQFHLCPVSVQYTSSSSSSAFPTDNSFSSFCMQDKIQYVGTP